MKFSWAVVVAAVAVSSSSTSSNNGGRVNAFVPSSLSVQQTRHRTVEQGWKSTTGVLSLSTTKGPFFGLRRPCVVPNSSSSWRSSLHSSATEEDAATETSDKKESYEFTVRFV